MNRPPKVFISYAHVNEEFENKILELSNMLRTEHNIDANIDQYEESPPQGWPRWMDDQIRESDYVLVVCNKSYFDKVNQYQTIQAKGVNWEINIVYQYLYDACCDNTKFIPVLLDSTDDKYVVAPLKGATYYNLSDDSQLKKLCNRLKGIKNVVKPALGQAQDNQDNQNIKLEAKERKTLFFTSAIDVDTWNEAGWTGVAYAIYADEKDAPVVGLVYKNKEAGEKIFKDWQGEVKGGFFNRIELSFVEENPITGYYVFVKTNFDEAIHRAEELGCKLENTLITFLTRYHHMEIVNDENLRRFRKSYKLHNRCYIAPVYLNGDGSGFPCNIQSLQIDYENMIQIAHVKFLDRKKLTDQDIERSILEDKKG